MIRSCHAISACAAIAMCLPQLASAEPEQLDRCLKQGEQDYFRLVDSKYPGEEHADVRTTHIDGDLETLEILGCGLYRDVHIIQRISSYPASGTYPIVHAMPTDGMIIVEIRDEGGEAAEYTLYDRRLGYKPRFSIEAGGLIGMRVDESGYEIFFEDIVRAECANGGLLKDQELYHRVHVVRVDGACAISIVRRPQ